MADSIFLDEDGFCLGCCAVELCTLKCKVFAQFLVGFSNSMHFMEIKLIFTVAFSPLTH